MACPPHHWLITQPDSGTSLQVWTCRRCGAHKEVASADGDQAPPGSNTWRSRRAPAPAPASDADARAPE